jgi:hypothetical protein
LKGLVCSAKWEMNPGALVWFYQKQCEIALVIEVGPCESFSNSRKISTPIMSVQNI